MYMQYAFDKAQHLHTLDGKALTGTSSVLDVLSKPLTWWASGLAVAELGWVRPVDTRKVSDKQVIEKNKIERVMSAQKMLERYKTMSINEYTALLDKAYRAHSIKLDKSAQGGVDLHQHLEDWVKSVIRGNEILPNYRIIPFVVWFKENCNKFLWSEAHCYSEKHWLGGITDCGVEMKNGEWGIIDFKSSREAYPSQFWQIAGYDIQVSEKGIFSSNGKHSKNFNDKPFTFYAVVPFGAEVVKPVINREIEACKRGFLAALEIYRQLAITDK